MNAIIQSTINELTREIAERQDIIKALNEMDANDNPRRDLNNLNDLDLARISARYGLNRGLGQLAAPPITTIAEAKKVLTS